MPFRPVSDVTAVEQQIMAAPPALRRSQAAAVGGQVFCFLSFVFQSSQIWAQDTGTSVNTGTTITANVNSHRRRCQIPKHRRYETGSFLCLVFFLSFFFQTQPGYEALLRCEHFHPPKDGQTPVFPPE